jgi:hypothetical protein
MPLRLDYPWKFGVTCCLLTIAISGCTPPQYPKIIEPAPTPAITPAIPVDAISIENVGELREMVTLSGTSREPIAALVFTKSAQELLAVHATSGLLVRWNLADGRQLSALNLGPVGIGAASIDGEGRWVVTGAGATPPAIEASLAVEFNGYRLYDARSGVLLYESSPYEIPILPVYDVALSADGTWVSDAVGGISVSERATGKPQLMVVMSSDYNYTLERSEIEQNATTFDTTGEWVALIADNGGVRLWNLTNSNIEGSMGMGTGPYETALVLAIDPTRRYIATVTTDHLVMRELRFTFRDLGFPGLIDETVAAGPAAGLAFSPDGTLLATSTKADWQLWSVAKRRRLHLENTGAYTVAFSPDGRLVAIGGTDGVIHVWSVLRQ